MKQKLSIRFVDFWPGFDQHANYFTTLLSSKFDFDFEAYPQVVFFSSFGKAHQDFNKTCKIYFTGENQQPNPYCCDYALSFDYPKAPWSFRWPLYNLYSKETAVPVVKDRFCSAVISNPSNPLRLGFLRRLGAKRHVDSGGRLLNNVGGPVVDKIDFLRRYRFNIAIENSSYQGYVTEKLLQAKQAGCIPIYWGDPLVANDFNPRSFICLDDYPDMDSCIDDILAIDDDKARYQSIADEPLHLPGKEYPHSSESRLLQFLLQAIEEPSRHQRSKVLAWWSDRQADMARFRYNRDRMGQFGY
jgi:alpha(1,3/1,4) fucosyltransferase